MESYLTAYIDLKLRILLSQSSELWDYRCVPSCPALGQQVWY